MSRRLDLWMALALAGFAAAMWWWAIPAYAGRGDQVIMPRIATALVGGLAVLLAVVSLWPRRAGQRDPSEDDPFLELGGGEPLRLVLLLVLWGVLLSFPRALGLHLLGALGIFFSFLLLGIKRPLVLVLGTVLPLALLHVVFVYGFALRIPQGTLVRALFG